MRGTTTPALPLAGFAKSLSVVTEATGDLVVFAVTQNDALYRKTLTSGWRALGADGTIQAIDAGTDTRGNANVFAMTTDDSFFRYNSLGWTLLGAPHTVVGVEAADSDRLFAGTADGSLFANDDTFGWYRLTGSGFVAVDHHVHAEAAHPKRPADPAGHVEDLRAGSVNSLREHQRALPPFRPAAPDDCAT